MFLGLAMNFGKRQKRYLNYSDKFRSCTGKMAYANKKQATRAAKEITVRKRVTNMRAYHCRYCPFWHVGRSEHIGRSLEERVECPKGCGNQIRQSRLEKHLPYCDGVGAPTLVDRRMEVLGENQQEDVETSDPYQSDLEQAHD